MRVITTLLVTLAAAMMMAPAPSQAAPWELIGVRTVHWGVDRDVVAVKGNDRHRQIRICVSGRPLHILDLDVVFANGGRQDVRVRSLIAPGTCTRAIDLRGKRRNIARIVMVYQRLTIFFSPIVRVYAR